MSQLFLVGPLGELSDSLIDHLKKKAKQSGYQRGSNHQRDAHPSSGDNRCPG